jgi:hypothetical protein
MAGAQCMVRRPAPGKSIGLPLRMPSPGSKEGHGCDEQARVLARTLPAERGHVENVDACNERRSGAGSEMRSGAEKACANAGGGQCSSHPHPQWTVGATADLEVLCGKANNSPANAAYGICTRCPVLNLKKPVGGASGLGGGGGIGNRNRATGNSEHLRRGDATRT